MTGTAVRWRTAHTDYTCEDAYQWAHSGRIHHGDRYAEVIVFPNDVIRHIARVRYCSQCAAGMPDVDRGALLCIPADPHAREAS